MLSMYVFACSAWSIILRPRRMYVVEMGSQSSACVAMRYLLAHFQNSALTVA